jgi:hypothetical protein
MLEAKQGGDAAVIWNRLHPIADERGADAGHTAALALATLALAFIADRHGAVAASSGRRGNPATRMVAPKGPAAPRYWRKP